jgi:hypothetical protein
MFQSPSLRGSGRFSWPRPPTRRLRSRFQSPSLRGSGRFDCVTGRTGWCAVVSIPFIAGQWSLLFLSWSRTASSAVGFNPLHCGAVVASGANWPRPPMRRCFNPLHCGAVVASGGGSWWLTSCGSCFNPLHCGAVVASGGQGGPMELFFFCFNPLHCGAVVASGLLLREPQ